jgi:hypothetical protein
MGREQQQQTVSVPCSRKGILQSPDRLGVPKYANLLNSSTEFLAPQTAQAVVNAKQFLLLNQRGTARLNLPLESAGSCRLKGPARGVYKAANKSSFLLKNIPILLNQPLLNLCGGGLGSSFTLLGALAG